MKYKKPKCICPFCQETKEDGSYRAFSQNGMPMHVRMRHAGNYSDYMEHRDEYNAMFACDEDGNPTGSAANDVDEVEVVEEVVEPEPEPEPDIVEPDPAPVAPTQTPVAIKTPVPAAKKSAPAKKTSVPKTEQKSVYNPYGY